MASSIDDNAVLAKIAGAEFINICAMLYLALRQAGSRKGEKMVDMGMTDKQFNGFVRFLLDALKDAMEEKESEKKEEKLSKIAENLQKTLED